MSRIIVSIFVLIGPLIASSQSNPVDFNDKYEYLVKVHEFRTNASTGHYAEMSYKNNGATYTGSNNEVHEQLNTKLNEYGESGWELVQTTKNIYTEGAYPGSVFSGGTDYKYTLLNVTISLKRLKYDASSAISKQVSYFSKLYADSIRVEMIDAINKNTWIQLGQFYKKEIVDEMIKKTAVLIEANNSNIINAIKKPD